MGILQSIAEYDPGVKILIYVAIFIVEKLLLNKQWEDFFWGETRKIKLGRLGEMGQIAGVFV